ncbi:MAG TPA: hypothetical protein VMW74_07855 [Nitrosopumilaceae archaeon]|nr:hypothetical protein [Nitrosopumilaceae archaeon]
MNKTISLAAIAMFAVIMGLGAFAPAVLAEKMPKVDLCHNDDGEDGIRGNVDDFWEQKSVNGNSLDKHIANHFDENNVFDFEVVDGATQATCDALVAADPDPSL